jgi:CubicO group peptidase (beta-lactamase class C family)
MEMRPDSFRVSRVAMLGLAACLSVAGASAGEPPRLAESEFKPLAARWKDAMEAFQVPGLSLVVVRGDEVIALDAMGVANVETGAKVTPDTIFYIASCTKTFNALSAVALAEDGSFDLDAPVQKYLPQLSLPDSELAAKLTPRDLLCHRYGLNSEDIVFLDAYSGEITDERFFRLLAGAEIAGEVTYSNIHFTLLGRALQAASGVKDWRDLLNDRILEPAGMTRTTGYADRIYQDKDVAMPHQQDGGKWFISPLRKSDRTMHAAGGLGSTARDLGQWLRLHLNAGRVDGEQIVSAAGLAEVLKEQSRLPQSRGQIRVEDSFGLGWMKGTFRGHGPYYSHGGGYVGASAYIAFMPEQKIGMAVMANAGDVGKALVDLIAVDVFDRLLQIDPPDDLLPGYKQRAGQYLARPSDRPAGENPAAARDGLSLDAKAYAGRYAHPDFGTCEMRFADGKLVGRIGDLPLELFSTGKDAFEAMVTPGMSYQGRFEIEGGRAARFLIERESGSKTFTRL